MTKSVTLAVVGGDVRQVHLAALLQADGHTVRTFALDRRPVEHCSAYGDLRACFSGVQAVILPLPVQHGTGSSTLRFPTRRTRFPRYWMRSLPGR